MDQCSIGLWNCSYSLRSKILETRRHGLHSSKIDFQWLLDAELKQLMTSLTRNNHLSDNILWLCLQVFIHLTHSHTVTLTQKDTWFQGNKIKSINLYTEIIYSFHSHSVWFLAKTKDCYELAVSFSILEHRWVSSSATRFFNIWEEVERRHLPSHRALPEAWDCKSIKREL